MVNRHNCCYDRKITPLPVDGVEPEERKENGLAWHSQNNITWTILTYSTVNSQRCCIVEMLEPYVSGFSRIGTSIFCLITRHWLNETIRRWIVAMKLHNGLPYHRISLLYIFSGVSFGIGCVCQPSAEK